MSARFFVMGEVKKAGRDEGEQDLGMREGAESKKRESEYRRKGWLATMGEGGMLPREGWGSTKAGCGMQKKDKLRCRRGRRWRATKGGAGCRRVLTSSFRGVVDLFPLGYSCTTHRTRI